MPFIPHTEEDIAAMLASIGAPSIDSLFDEIPPALRSGALTRVPEGLSEMEVARLMQERAEIDGRYLNFSAPALTNITFRQPSGRSSRAANFTPPIHPTRPRRAKVRCNCCTNIRP